MVSNCGDFLRMQRAQEITTLRFYFMSWMNEHNKCKRNKKFALEEMIMKKNGKNHFLEIYVKTHLIYFLISSPSLSQAFYNKEEFDFNGNGSIF